MSDPSLRLWHLHVSYFGFFFPNLLDSFVRLLCLFRLTPLSVGLCFMSLRLAASSLHLSWWQCEAHREVSSSSLDRHEP